MNQPPHDPNSLNDELDRLLTGEENASAGDPLVEAAARLNTAPRPRLSPQAADRIRTAVLAAHAAAPTAPSVSLLTPSRPLRLALVAAATIVLVAATLFAARNNLQFLGAPTVDSIVTQTHTPAPSLTPTLTSSVPLIPPEVTAVQASATAMMPSVPSTERPAETASVTAVVPSATITASATTVPASPAVMPSSLPTLLPATVTLSPTSTVTHTPAPTEPPAETTAATAEPSMPVTIVIEGPVQAINGSTITIFDLVILLNPDDPLLRSIAVGVFIRVEGSFETDNGIITALYVTLPTPEPLVNSPAGAPEVNQNPSGGEVWVDTGDCNNPPPPWAPANGWRRRCENLNSSGNNGSSGQNENQGNGSRDDDDDGGDDDDGDDDGDDD